MRVQFPLSAKNFYLFCVLMNNSVIIIDDNNNRCNRIKASLEVKHINVFIAESIYELIGKIYQYNIHILIFNPDLCWINVIDFIMQLKKFFEKDLKIFFIYETIDETLKKEAKKLNVLCIKYPSHINKLIKNIK